MKEAFTVRMKMTELRETDALLLKRPVHYIVAHPRQLPTTLHFAAESETEAAGRDDQADGNLVTKKLLNELAHTEPSSNYETAAGQELQEAPQDGSSSEPAAEQEEQRMPAQEKNCDKVQQDERSLCASEEQGDWELPVKTTASWGGSHGAPAPGKWSWETPAKRQETAKQKLAALAWQRNMGSLRQVLKYECAAGWGRRSKWRPKTPESTNPAAVQAQDDENAVLEQPMALAAKQKEDQDIAKAKTTSGENSAGAQLDEESKMADYVKEQKKNDYREVIKVQQQKEETLAPAEGEQQKEKETNGAAEGEGDQWRQCGGQREQIPGETRQGHKESRSCS